jgi:hypothetical protein
MRQVGTDTFHSVPFQRYRRSRYPVPPVLPTAHAFEREIVTTP